MLPAVGEGAVFARHCLACRAAHWNFLQGCQRSVSALFHVAATNHTRLVIKHLQCG